MGMDCKVNAKYPIFDSCIYLPLSYSEGHESLLHMSIPARFKFITTQVSISYTGNNQIKTHLISTWSNV